MKYVFVYQNFYFFLNRVKKTNTLLCRNQNLEKNVLYSVWVLKLYLLKLKNAFAVGCGCSTSQKQPPPPEVFFEKGVIKICIKFIEHLRIDFNEVAMHECMNVPLYSWCILSENLLIRTALGNESNQ